MRTPELKIETDSTGVWTHISQIGGTDLGVDDGDQLPHRDAAMRAIVSAMDRLGLRHAIIDGERVDVRAWARRDSYCRRYHPDFAAVGPIRVYPLGSDTPVEFSSIDAARAALGDDFVTADDCRANGDDDAADALEN